MTLAKDKGGPDTFSAVAGTGKLTLLATGIGYLLIDVAAREPRVVAIVAVVIIPIVFQPSISAVTLLRVAKDDR